MIKDLCKWVMPGLATVLGGTGLCLAMTTTTIVEDLETRSAAALAAGGFDWAEPALDLRDLTLSGITTDQSLVDAALSYLEHVPGLRSVTADVVLAPRAEPYRLEASIKDGAVRLAGAVPDAATRQKLLALAGIEDGELELRSGVPSRRDWAAGAGFAVEQLRYFDQGEAIISDRTIHLKGRARSEQAFRDLLVVQRAGAPQGMELGEMSVAPALVSPYRWNAVSDGRRIDITGHVPDMELAERLRLADLSGRQVATALHIGSGAPDGFAELSTALLEQLARLDYGEASIIDGESRLTGAPATLEIAQSVSRNLQTEGSIVVLEPPRIDDYWVSVVRQAGGALIFDGYAPDAATRAALGATPGADIAELKLGRGAPDRYRAGVDFGLAALDLMEAGRMALRANALTLTGIAASEEAYLALLALVGAQTPQGIEIAAATIQPPPATPYLWSARRGEDGGMALSGHAPDPQIAAELLAAAGPAVEATMSYASGEPANFAGNAHLALELLPHLASGEAAYDGTLWRLSGMAASPADRAALDARFAESELAGWVLDVAEAPPALPEIAPYRWSASRDGDGIALAGHVPNAGMQRFLALRAGADARDDTELGTGAPADFALIVPAALDAIKALEDGMVRYDGAAWSLTGTASSPAARDAAIGALEAVTPTQDWTIAVTAPEPEPETSFHWTAHKAGDGIVTLSGMVPAQTVQRFLAVRLGDAGVDQTEIGAAAPPGFVADMLAALTALEGMTMGEARFDEAGWSIEGQAAADADIAAALATAATPMADWAVSVEAAALPEEIAAALAGADPDYAFSARRDDDGAVILSGQIPAEAALSYFEALSQADTAAVSVAEGAPESFLPSAEIGLRALMHLREGELDFSAGKWSLAGTAPDAGARQAVLAAIAGDPGNGRWITAIDLPPPEAEPVVAAAPRSAQPADISACAAPVAAFSARNAILFQSGAAVITAASEAALDELAQDLAACADAVVHVEGHTDSDGDAALNLALSVARAEAVVAALIERGVAPARLYAVGYGETAPIADNGTAEGKRLNRRIVVVVRPEHY